MNKYIIPQAFTEYIQGVSKGSMNRVLMFMLGLTICIIAVIVAPKLNVQNILAVTGLVTTLGGLLLTLAGFSMSAKKADIANAPTNQNTLVAPTPVKPAGE